MTRTAKPLFAGLQWYYDLDQHRVSSVADLLMDAAERLLGRDGSLRTCCAVDVETFRTSRSAKITRERLLAMESQASAGAVSLVYLEGDKMLVAGETLPGPTVWLRTIPDEGQEGQRSRVPHSVTLTFGWSERSAPLPTVGQVMSWVADQLRSPHAIGFVAERSVERNCELEPVRYQFTGELREDGTVPLARDENNERLELLSILRARFGDEVRGAYWANYFGPSLVQRLGGPSSLLALDADVVTVGDDGGVFVQLTNHLRPVDDAVLAPRLAALRQLLAPITVPHTYAARRLLAGAS